MTPTCYISVLSARLRDTPSRVSAALAGQLDALPMPKEVDEVQAYIAAVQLPFPATLGLVDSKEYANSCACVITKLEAYIRNAGLTPELRSR